MVSTKYYCSFVFNAIGAYKRACCMWFSNTSCLSSPSVADHFSLSNLRMNESTEWKIGSLLCDHDKKAGLPGPLHDA